MNVLGEVSDPDGVARVQYRLERGAWVTMQVGADDRRLAGTGDINVDLHVDDLRAGANRLDIRVIDDEGDTTTRTVTVDLTSGRRWALPTTIDWSGNVEDLVQPVDGEWRITGGRLNNVDDGYDRIVVLGDLSWTDYEVVVPVRIGTITPDADAWPSNGPGVGLALRWRGHNDSVDPGSQPLVGFRPEDGDPVFGSVLFWRDERRRAPAFEMYDENNQLVESEAPFTMSSGVDYAFKAQVEGSRPTTYRWMV